jgi:hypothetical protein
MISKNNVDLKKDLVIKEDYSLHFGESRGGVGWEKRESSQKTKLTTPNSDSHDNLVFQQKILSYLIFHQSRAKLQLIYSLGSS